MIIPLFEAIKKGFSEEMPHKDSQRWGRDGTAHKRHVRSNNQKMENVCPVWETAGSLVWLEGSVCTSHCPHVMLHMSYSCPSQLLEGKPGVFFISVTNILCFYMLAYPGISSVWSLFLFWHSVSHPKGPDLHFLTWTTICLRKAFHDLHSILRSLLKSKILNTIYPILCDFALASSLTSPCASVPGRLCSGRLAFLQLLGKKVKQTSALLRGFAYTVLYTEHSPTVLRKDDQGGPLKWTEIGTEWGSKPHGYLEEFPNRKMAQKKECTWCLRGTVTGPCGKGRERKGKSSRRGDQRMWKVGALQAS